jgi:hypothetical protein
MSATRRGLDQPTFHWHFSKVSLAAVTAAVRIPLGL